MDHEGFSDSNSITSSSSANKIRAELSLEDVDLLRNRSSVSTISTLGKNNMTGREVKLRLASGPLNENTLKGIADYILSGKARKILLLTGAGVSTSAGIPDFRSPNHNIYSCLSKLNIDPAEFSFDIDVFRRNPVPFYAVFNSHIGQVKNAKPTPAHYFMKLLADKNLLLRVYTQNVDGLETSAGIDPQLIVEVHGTLRRAKCANCGTPVPIESLESAVFAKCVLNCSICGGVIKPDVVFFGEQLPDRFFELLEDDCANCDMIIIAGTSLMVHPVSSIAQLVPTDIPRVLINKEKVGLFKQSSDCLYSPSISESSTSTDNYRSDPSFSSKPSLDETEDNNENMDLLIYDRDVTWLGNCDDGFKELSMYLGWRDELESLIKK